MVRDLNKTFSGRSDYDNPSALGNAVDQSDMYIREYSKYRFYIGVGESCILLLIILCITFGLMCGVCGKRPDGYDDDCCNKGSGSRFLMIGVGIMFFFSFVLMSINLVYFLTGMLNQRVFCDTLNDPNSELFEIIDKTFVNKYIPNNVSNIIKSCHRNESAYLAFNLKTRKDVTKLPDLWNEYRIVEQIERFKSNIHLNGRVTIIDKKTERELEKLEQSGIGSINLDRFMEIVSPFLLP